MIVIPDDGDGGGLDTRFFFGLFCGGQGGPPPIFPPGVPGGNGPLAPLRQPPAPPGYKQCIEGALEEVVAAGETPNAPDNGYGTLVGGTVMSISNPTMIAMGAFVGQRGGHHLSLSSLSLLSGNPQIFVQVHPGDPPRAWSSAFGRYQITNRLAAWMGFTDFTPSGQDDAAAALLNYYDAVVPAMQGNLQQAVWNMWLWQSMPDSSLGGRHISMDTATSVFQNALNTLPECQ